LVFAGRQFVELLDEFRTKYYAGWDGNQTEAGQEPI
jgi:hypothetical protein